MSWKIILRNQVKNKKNKTLIYLTSRVRCNFLHVEMEMEVNFGN